MIPVETIPEIRGKGMKENRGGSEFSYNMFDILYKLL
jgi:hypothetical protein